jgi:hypothetical protein
MVELNFHAPIPLRGVMLEYFSTGTALPFKLRLHVLDIQPILVARLLSAGMLRCVKGNVPVRN